MHLNDLWRNDHNPSATRSDQPKRSKGGKKSPEFLGEPVSVAKRWRAEETPVLEQGRFVSSTPEQLSAWLGRESGKPVHVVTSETDLSSELRRGIAFARRSQKGEKKSG